MNEAKKFTPSLTIIKMHGSQLERDRILSMPQVLLRLSPSNNSIAPVLTYRCLL